MLFRHADAHSFQSVLVEKPSVIRVRLAPALRGRLVSRILAGQSAENDCRVSDSSRHWVSRVLTMRDGIDACRADKNVSWFVTDPRVCLLRSNDRFNISIALCLS